MRRKPRPATIRIELNPKARRRRWYVVKASGRVVCRTINEESAQAFITGWRQSEAESLARWTAEHA